MGFPFFFVRRECGSALLEYIDTNTCENILGWSPANPSYEHLPFDIFPHSFLETMKLQAILFRIKYIFQPWACTAVWFSTWITKRKFPTWHKKIHLPYLAPKVQIFTICPLLKFSSQTDISVSLACDGVNFKGKRQFCPSLFSSQVVSWVLIFIC